MILQVVTAYVPSWRQQPLSPSIFHQVASGNRTARVLEKALDGDLGEASERLSEQQRADWKLRLFDNIDIGDEEEVGCRMNFHTELQTR